MMNCPEMVVTPTTAKAIRTAMYELDIEAASRPSPDSVIMRGIRSRLENMSPSGTSRMMPVA
jgi:hypothetical protein